MISIPHNDDYDVTTHHFAHNSIMLLHIYYMLCAKSPLLAATRDMAAGFAFCCQAGAISSAAIHTFFDAWLPNFVLISYASRASH